MQGKAAKRVGNGEEKYTFAAKHRAYRAKDIDPVFFSLDMGKHAEECYNQVIRTCCSYGTEVSGDQQTLTAAAGGRGLQLQRLARVS
jgi:hypothetical protein